MRFLSASANIYDLTLPISKDLVVFPGDPSFRAEKLMDVDKGQGYTLQEFHLCNHAGTHIDFPGHIIKGGALSSRYSADRLMGNGIIIETPGVGNVTKDIIEKAEIQEGDIVFFKTENSRRKLHETGYTEDFAAISPEAAELLVKQKASIIGIDYLSVDCINDHALTIHKILLSNDVLIVENLNLTQVPGGRYIIMIAPLNVADADGLPARVFAISRPLFKSQQNEYNDPGLTTGQ